MSRVVELLGPQGPLARCLPGYEHRPGQLDMARAVEQAIDQGHALVCEAGTGTGKTLAYLVPAILSGRKVVVSTATRALQDQIVSHDIPAIETYLGLRPDVAVAKGLSNYLCLRRFDELRNSADAVRPGTGRTLGILERWSRETETGDVAELPWLPENDPLWRQVCSSAETRRGGKCNHYRECFVTRMRRRAEEAKIVIANHHLVFADLALREGSRERGGVLPEHEVLIFDEAHQMEDIASEFFGLRVSSARVEAFLRESERVLRHAGLDDTLLGSGSGQTLVDRVRGTARDFFGELVVRFGAGEVGKRALAQDDWAGSLLSSYHQLDAALEALQALAQGNTRDEDVMAAGRRAFAIRQELAEIVDGNRQAVTWVETRSRSAAVGSTPIEVATILRERVHERIGTVVMTSATLSTNRGFAFFRSRVGADSPYVRTEELTVASPFDFPNVALLYTPQDLPEPGQPEYPRMASERTAELIQITGGGALVLSTSNRGMELMRAELQRLLGRPVTMQGDAPKRTLLSRFRTDGNEVLVATMSFWGGVDVAGDALRLVVIDKIPFAVPNDPVVMARCEVLQKAGENPFVKYQVPSAAIMLKQGFGRLIRTTRDRGIVAVLDVRLLRKGYGKSLLASLPPARRVTSMQEVQSFWAQHGGSRRQQGEASPAEL